MKEIVSLQFSAASCPETGWLTGKIAFVKDVIALLGEQLAADSRAHLTQLVQEHCEALGQSAAKVPHLAGLIP